MKIEKITERLYDAAVILDAVPDNTQYEPKPDKDAMKDAEACRVAAEIVEDYAHLKKKVKKLEKKLDKKKNKIAGLEEELESVKDELAFTREGRSRGGVVPQSLPDIPNPFKDKTVSFEENEDDSLEEDEDYDDLY